MVLSPLPLSSQRPQLSLHRSELGFRLKPRNECFFTEQAGVQAVSILINMKDTEDQVTAFNRLDPVQVLDKFDEAVHGPLTSVTTVWLIAELTQ